MDKGLTKQHSNMLYGLAILLMIYHHLFGIPEMIGNDYYSVLGHLFPWIEEPRNVERYIAYFGKICVAIYAFVSGYGLCRSSSQSVEGKPVKKLIKDYKATAIRYLNFILKPLIVACLFVPTGYALGKEFVPVERILLSALGVENIFCGSWWYSIFYVGMLFYFPILNFIFSEGFKNKTSEYRLKTLIVILGGGMVFFYRIPWRYRCYASIFAEGYLCARYLIFERLHSVLRGKKETIICIMTICVCVMIRIAASQAAAYNSIDPLIIAPFVYAVWVLFDKMGSLNHALQRLGKYSTYMWLTHEFFCFRYFTSFTTMSHISTVIFVQTVAMSWAVAWLLRKIEKAVQGGFRGFTSYCLERRT